MGAIGLAGIGIGKGIQLRSCKGIHTFFMRFPIDVVGLDQNYRILEIRRNVEPWRRIQFSSAADSVLEMTAGSAKKWETGDTVSTETFLRRSELETDMAYYDCFL